MIEHDEAESGVATPDPVGVSHALHGPPDVTEVLALFDRRYREVRGEDPPDRNWKKPWDSVRRSPAGILAPSASIPWP